MKAKLIYRIIVLLTLFLTISFLPRLIFDYDPTLIRQTQLFTIVRVLLIFIFICEITALFYYFVVKSQLNGFIKNLISIVYSLLFIFFLLEAVFMFVPRSHFAGIPLCAKVWFYRYWKPINEYGYRDKPVSSTSKINIFTLGDSFTAGHGLKKIEDRYSNVLESMLVKNYSDLQVINMGVNGSDTKDEYNTLMAFMKESQIKPDFIILQYFGNDIERIAKKNGIRFRGFDAYKDLPGGLDQIVKSSYFFNYIYWIYPHADVKSYLTFLYQSYNDEQSFNEHTKDLDLFISYSREKNIPLLILIFPFMQDLKFSDDLYIQKLSVFFSSKGVDYVDVAKLIEDLPVKERVINNNDGHANAKVNRRIANEINQFIQRKHILSVVN